MTKHKIARLIVTGKHYDKYGDPHYQKLKNGIEKFIANTYGKQHFEFIVTPGGFLKFQIPISLYNSFSEGWTEEQILPELTKEGEKTVQKFIRLMSHEALKKLKTIANFLTIGVDGRYPYYYPSYLTTELVCVYNLKRNQLIHWTGKFYPVESQKKVLVKVNDLKSHLIELNNQKIAILGCHDLNVYNPRGQASAGLNSWKRNTSEKFRKLCAKFNPTMILQHPHTTDTPNIWNLAWRTVEKDLPNVRHFASGIMYHNWRSAPRGGLEKVLAKTKKGDVTDFCL